MSTSTSENYEELLAAAELSESECYRVLSVERRRVVCDVLADQAKAISVDRLATVVAERETSTDDTECETAADAECETATDNAEYETSADSPDREAGRDESPSSRSVEIALHHVHLPKLAAAGIVDYDEETRRVEAAAGTQ